MLHIVGIECQPVYAVVMLSGSPWEHFSIRRSTGGVPSARRATTRTGELTGDEVFAVGTRISTHARELGPDLIDQVLLLLSFGDRESSLENVV